MDTQKSNHLAERLAAAVAQERANTANLLAHLAEVDARQLHLRFGYTSMQDFCLDELGLDEDEIAEQITAARTARRFPVLFTALEEGRLHLAAVRLLAPHLTPGNVDELLAAATHQAEPAIRRMLARRFP